MKAPGACAAPGRAMIRRALASLVLLAATALAGDAAAPSPAPTGAPPDKKP